MVMRTVCTINAYGHKVGDKSRELRRSQDTARALISAKSGAVFVMKNAEWYTTTTILGT